MANITFIGMGEMGSRMALNLIVAGHTVCVWNRTSERLTPLLKAGAHTAQSPHDAAKEADIVISMLRDDEASKAVWCDPKTGALAGMKAGAIAMECSTLSVKWVKALSQCCADKEIAFIDAPVAGSRPQAEAAQLIFFVGGGAATFEFVRPVLAHMGETIHYAGASGAGAAVKLAVNSLFGVQLATIAELIGIFYFLEIDANQAINLLTSTPVCSSAAKAAAGAMLTDQFPPLFPISLVEKDFSYASTMTNNGLTTPLIKAAHEVFQQAMENGLGNDNITGVVQLYAK